MAAVARKLRLDVCSDKCVCSGVPRERRHDLYPQTESCRTRRLLYVSSVAHRLKNPPWAIRVARRPSGRGDRVAAR
jgi:hypothetical protein